MGTVEISKRESVEYYEGQRHSLAELRGLESYWWCKEEDKPVGELKKKKKALDIERPELYIMEASGRENFDVARGN